MRIAYVAGPYRSDTVYGIRQNIAAAEAVALKYWKLGYAVICPHKNTAGMDGALPDVAWLSGDIEILKRCDVVVMMQGWTNSAGAFTEHDVAIKEGIEVIYDCE